MSCPKRPSIDDIVTHLRVSIARTGCSLTDGLVAMRQMMNAYPDPDVEAAIFILEGEARAERQARQRAEEQLRAMRSPFTLGGIGILRR